MDIAQLIYDFFGFEVLTTSATFTELLDNILKIGCGLWVTIFIIRSMFLVMTAPNIDFK